MLIWCKRKFLVWVALGWWVTLSNRGSLAHAPPIWGQIRTRAITSIDLHLVLKFLPNFSSVGKAKLPARTVGPCEFSFSVALRHQMTMLWEADESFSLWLKPAGHQSQPGRRCRKRERQQTFGQLFDGFLCDTAT